MTENAILKNLNPAQKEAVTWPASPLLILAGAGSGKTRILTSRIAWLIAQGVPAFNILGVTFTNKAAQEMNARVQRLVSQSVWIHTFHSTCLRILRTDGPAIEIDRNFTIYDDYDQLVLIKECLKELNLNEKQVHPKGVRERISLAKDILMTPYQFAENASDLFEESVSKVYRRYEEKLGKLKALDFGDLIMKTVALFDRKPEVLASWQERFQHVLIDEYQDTNHAQYRMVKLLAQKRRQITVVGDPDQSIYAWRGADIKNILNFEKDYPDCGSIRMEQNYRSTMTILQAANQLIERNQMRKPKALWSEREDGQKISLFEARDEKEEALYVARKVLENRQAGKILADQVIFYRVHAQSRVLEDALRRFNIPYKIVGGVRFYDRKEIKDIIAYLRVITNPHDDVSLKRILNVPARGIGKKALEILEQTAAAAQVSFDQVLRDASKINGLPPKARSAIGAFYPLLASLRKEYPQMELEDVLKKILERSGYLAELEAEKTIEAQARIENIEEFFTVIEDFVAQARLEEGQTPLQAFLESISLMTNIDSWEQGTDVLTLMTFHTAKGLEFPIVFMVGLEEGIFPNVKSYSDSLSDLEEERRLCYVGITRAKDKLHISYTRQRHLYGSTHYNLPSRFLNEIPPQLFETLCAVNNLSSEAPSGEASDDIEIDFDFDDSRRRILFD